ncbi:11847_t:CDS:2 [Funneliformis geosporum]|uniref:14712_t:CDS:1 n=1 Tax=Funneliformis geosporum TaxID=1117311 RepID=A0A9W4SGL3_9GLOM|nr:14712_t:CDS:2 [Funneliformis geosporum]CAI2170013.1 11847_t:CDS:2 [Funneliformis geosporum]
MHKKLAILIYDNVSRIDPKILDIIQVDAKDSESILSVDSWTQTMPIFEISDFKIDKQSATYLVNKLGTPLEETKIYELISLVVEL